jgi:aminopeptidase N
MDKPKTLRLKDYQLPEFSTKHVDLDFNINEDHTLVTSKVTYHRTDIGKDSTSLILNADNPNPDKDYIKSIKLGGNELAQGSGYEYDKDSGEIKITVDTSEDNLEVEIETYLQPELNHALKGLYKSDSCFVTQCEAQDFRRITPFLDRPDVMATYDVRVEAPKDICPVLMSNGNMLESGDLKNGRHYAKFQDPFPKPSYLFATANGDLDYVEGKFQTMNDREVTIRVYTEKGESEKAQHALEAVKMAMKWDEDVFGCEYDLDNFNVVAVAKFNAGAMENKGLNVFRDSLILANPDIATDSNYQRIIDVIGHEYFHNYSGDRVTLANWFNLSLKEGLTVIREQMFTAFTTSEAVERIQAVSGLRASQFPEDDGPLAHPVMPQELQSVDNIYTGTVYEKGAEVIRMMSVLMGQDKFIDGVKDYFKTNDGQAVTIKEFVQSMEKVSGLNLSDQFSLWYTQSGRPRVTAEGQYDPDKKTYTLTLEQQVPPTKDQPHKDSMYIPIKMALIDKNGTEMSLEQDGDTSCALETVLHLTEDKQTFVFKNVNEEPAFHSLLRGFSAPVDLNSGLSEDQLHQQLLLDTDGFNRWDAGQKLALEEMKRLYNSLLDTGALPEVSSKYITSLKKLAQDTTTDPALIAEALSLPTIKEFEATIDTVNPSAVAQMRKHLTNTIGKELYNDFADVFSRTHNSKAYSFDYESVGKRSLKNIAINSLVANGDPKDIEGAKNFYFLSNNMTDKMIAMNAIRNHLGKERAEVLDDFYNQFKDDQLTIQKWFMTQARSESDGIIDELKQVITQKEFNWQNPGHVSSVFLGLASNYQQFHRPDGKGYEFLADGVMKMDTISPQIASRMIEPLCNWKDYSDDHQKLMISQLERMKASGTLSNNVKDKLFKALPTDQERANLNIPQP